MTEEPEHEALSWLRELVDKYGVEGLKERIAGAIQEAEDGRVEGPGIEAAATWLEKEQGPPVPKLGVFGGEGHLTLSAAGVSATAGALSLSGEGTLSLGQHLHRSLTEVAGGTDHVMVEVTKAVDLPSNVQVLAMVHDAFFYLLDAWGLLHVPVEVVPFALLMALAIVVLRIRLKQ